MNAQGVGENVRGVAEMTKVWVKSFDGLTEADTHLEGNYIQWNLYIKGTLGPAIFVLNRECPLSEVSL